MRQDDSESLDSTTTEWFDEQPYPGPSSIEVDFTEFVKNVRLVGVQVQRSYEHMEEQFKAISKALFPHVHHVDVDKPQKPFTPQVRNHGPRQGKPYRSDGKRKW